MPQKLDKVSLVNADSLSRGDENGKASKAMKKYANMSDEIEQLDLELSELMTEIRKSVEAMEWDTKKVAMTKDAKEAEFKRIKTDMDKARTLMQTYKVELRDLSAHEARDYEYKLRKHQESLAELERNLQFARTSAEKAELMDGRKAEAKTPENMGATQLIEEAKKTQEQDAAALDRMAKMVEDSEEVGLATNIKLKIQTEQLKNINTDVNTVQANMKRADKLLTQISKRMMTDKLIACLVLLLLLGIIVLLVVKALGLDKGTNNQQNTNIVIYNGLPIDCSLDFTRTRQQCIELHEQQRQAEELKKLQEEQSAQNNNPFP